MKKVILFCMIIMTFGCTKPTTERCVGICVHRLVSESTACSHNDISISAELLTKIQEICKENNTKNVCY